jgi:hypothetical protein
MRDVALHATSVDAEAITFNKVTPLTGAERPGPPTVAVSRTGGGQNTVTWTAVPGVGRWLAAPAASRI